MYPEALAGALYLIEGEKGSAKFIEAGRRGIIAGTARPNGLGGRRLQ